MCCVATSDPRCFLPVTMYHSHTLGAHVLATVVGPSPNGPQFCHVRYIRPGGVTPVDHESAQLSRLEAVAVGSPLQSPPPHPGDRRALTREFARGGQGSQNPPFLPVICALCARYACAMHEHPPPLSPIQLTGKVQDAHLWTSPLLPASWHRLLDRSCLRPLWFHGQGLNAKFLDEHSGFPVT